LEVIIDPLQEKRDIVSELEYRFKQNPLKFHELLPMQQKFKDDPKKKKNIFGGNRSGKTEGTADDVVDDCLKNENKKWWVGGETFQDSVAIQQLKIHNLVPPKMIKYGKYNPITGYVNRKLLFTNGSLITFKSYDQGRESFQSDDLDGIWLDEEPPKDIYDECKMRLLDRNGKLLISMTSLKGVTDLIEDIFQDSEIIESQYAELVGKELPRISEKNGTKFYFLWTTENPHINQRRLREEAEHMTKQEIEARVYGMPINLSGKIYMSMNTSIHVTSIEEMPEGDYTIYHVLDPHDRKPFAMIWIAVHVTGTAYVIDEYPGDKNFNEMEYDDKDYEEYAKEIRRIEESIKDLFGVGIHKRIIDPNFGNKTVKKAKREGGSSMTTPKKELQKLGLYYKDGIDSLEAGHLAVRKKLFYKRHPKSDEIVVQPTLFFCNHCTNTIRHHLKYARKPIVSTDGDVKDKVGPQEKYKDFCDVVRYGVMANLVYVKEIRRDKEFEKAY